jgi:hypothetical protein
VLVGVNDEVGVTEGTGTQLPATQGIPWLRITPIGLVGLLPHT